MNYKIADLNPILQDEIKKIERMLSADLGRPIALVAWEPEPINAPLKPGTYTMSGIGKRKKAGD